jgi:hypothetical protein
MNVPSAIAFAKLLLSPFDKNFTRIQDCKEMVKERGKWPTICGVLKGCGFSLTKPPIMGLGNLGFQP